MAIFWSCQALNADETYHEIIQPILEQENAISFPGIPSLRLKDLRGPYVQGIDRFIEGMRGEKYVLVIIAEPVPLPDIDGMISNLFDIGTSIHSLVKATVQQMKGSADTLNMGLFGMKGSRMPRLNRNPIPSRNPKPNRNPRARATPIWVLAVSCRRPVAP